MRPRTASLLVSVSSLLAAFPALGCDLDGDSAAPPLVGTFALDMTVVENQCGYSGVPVSDENDVLAEVAGVPGQPATFKWLRIGTTVDGSVSTAERYTFASTRSVVVREPTTYIGNFIPGCTLIERSQITFNLDPTPVLVPDGGVVAPLPDDAEARTLDGTYTLDVYATGDSNCSDQLGTSGGAFARLPCQVNVKLEGVQQ